MVATGVYYRRLEAEGVEGLIGAGVFYGSSPSEAPHYRDGGDSSPWSTPTQARPGPAT